MNPLSLGIPFLPAAMRGASLLASGGVDFLQALTAPQASPPSIDETIGEVSRSKTDASTSTSLQLLVGKELSQAGFGEALPLELVDNGSGGIRVVSDHPRRQAIEQFLNDHPTILEQFRELAKRAAASETSSQDPFRLTIATTSGFDYSA